MLTTVTVKIVVIVAVAKEKSGHGKSTNSVAQRWAFPLSTGKYATDKRSINAKCYFAHEAQMRDDGPTPFTGFLDEAQKGELSFAC